MVNRFGFFNILCSPEGWLYPISSLTSESVVLRIFILCWIYSLDVMRAKLRYLFDLIYILSEKVLSVIIKQLHKIFILNVNYTIFCLYYCIKHLQRIHKKQQHGKLTRLKRERPMKSMNLE
jgi:hypothetical protein